MCWVRYQVSLALQRSTVRFLPWPLSVLLRGVALSWCLIAFQWTYKVLHTVLWRYTPSRATAITDYILPSRYYTTLRATTCTPWSITVQDEDQDSGLKRQWRIWRRHLQPLWEGQQGPPGFEREG